LPGSARRQNAKPKTSWRCPPATGPASESRYSFPPSHLFDHLVGAREQHGRHFEAERLNSVQIDYKLELGRLQDRQVRRLAPLKNPAREIELEGILRVYKIDQTALFFDARSAVDFAKASLPGTHNVPADQIATDGLRKAPMPSNDFNTRIVSFGRDFAQARALADAVGKTPFQNVSYFPGTFDALSAAVRTQ
jgi:hypothetical protein